MNSRGCKPTVCSDDCSALTGPKVIWIVDRRFHLRLFTFGLVEATELKNQNRSGQVSAS